MRKCGLCSSKSLYVRFVFEVMCEQERKREREGREEREERVRESASGAERVGGRPRAAAIYVNIFLMVSSETFAMLLGKNMKH